MVVAKAHRGVRAVAGLVTLMLLTACADTTAGGEGDAASVGDDPPIEIVFAHPSPPQHMQYVAVLEPWLEEVTERTGGTVTFDVHPAGSLSGPDDAYQHPAENVTDMGWALQGWTPGRFPVTEIIEIPFLFESGTQATEVLWDLYDEFDALRDEYADTKVLALYAHDVGDLHTVDVPVVSTEDVAGLSIRTPGSMQNHLVESLGGNGVGMPSPELYDALDRGVIDGLMIGHSGVPNFDLQEVLGHVTAANAFVAPFFLVMSLTTWESLSPAQQEVFEETTGRELSLALSRDQDGDGEDARAQWQEWGFEVHELDDEQLAAWRDATAQVPQAWIDRQGDDVPAEEMHDFMLERLDLD